MRSDLSEYKPIIDKLIEKTRQRRVEWTESLEGFKCTLGTPAPKVGLIAQLGSSHDQSFSFTIGVIGRYDSGRVFTMLDEAGKELFRVVSNDLPTSPEEEEVSNLLEELYELARRQALKVDEKLGDALTLLEKA